MDELKKLLREHQERYPELTIIDLVKLLYQNEFGPGHFITDEEASLARLTDELGQLKYEPKERFESIGNGLARLHLGAVGNALSPETINRLFVLTAAQERGSIQGFEAKLSVLRELYPSVDLDQFLAEYKENGYPPMSHSSVYRDRYAPSYRVVSGVFARYFSVFERIEELLAGGESPIIVALDGRSGSGKSFLSQLLKDVYGCSVVSMDHFFLRPEQRTRARLAEAGGNIDYERFQLEVLPNLRSGRSFSYQIYDCQQGTFTKSPVIKPHRLVVVEGSYSHHPLFREVYDLKVFLTVDSKVQQERLLNRNGPAMLHRFLTEWIPMEEHYFSILNIPEKSDVLINTNA